MMKTKLWSVTCNTKFDSGAGIQIVSSCPAEIHFQAPWNNSPNPMWYHFRVRGARGWTVRFVHRNILSSLGANPKHLEKKRVRPVYTTDGLDVSPSQRNWKRVRAEDISFDSDSRSYAFTIRVTGDELYVAHSYPYNLEAWQELVDAHADHPDLCVDTIGRTEMGRPIPQATIGTKGAANRETIWLFARNHAAEVGGAWALDGHLRWLLGDNEDAGWLRQHYCTRVIPFVDLDGVLEGWYGKDRAPRDFNRAWLADSPRPEIRRYLKEILKTRPVFVLDYHSPDLGGGNYALLSQRSSVPLEQWPIHEYFGETAKRLSPRSCAIDRVLESFHSTEATETYCRRGVFNWCFGNVGSSAELSYAVTAAGRVIQRRGYQAMGAAYAKALVKTLKRFGHGMHPIPWTDFDRQIRLYPEYTGDAFRGWLQWRPPTDASLHVRTQTVKEVLQASIKKQGGMVHIASPRQPLTKTIVVKYDLKAMAGTPTQVLGKLLYYDDHGLQYERHDLFELPPTKGWHRTTVTPNPPAGATHRRLSLQITGGRGRFRLWSMQS